MNRLRIAALGAWLAAATLLSGCPASPGQVCQHMVDSIDHMYTRCGYPYRVQLTLDGMTTDCGHVARVTNAAQLLHQCVPWADSVACSDVVEDADGVPQLDPSCDFALLAARP